jgi:hypothetical protein
MNPRSEPTGPAPKPRPAAAVTNRRIAGYWSIMWEGRAGYARRWVGLDHRGDPEVITCDHDSDAPLCPTCVGRLGDVLLDVPALLWDLWLAETRDVRFVEHGTRAEDEPSEGGGWPWNERAAKARGELQRAVTEFARAMLQGVETTGPRRYGELAHQLRHQLGRIARHDTAPGWAHRLSRAVAGGHRAIDRPADRWYFGECPKCGAPITGDRTRDPRAIIECPRHPECSYRAEMEDHQRAQLEAGADRWLTVDELVGAIARAGGQVVTRDQISRWARHGGLPRESQPVPRWVDGTIITDTVDTHRLGDVLAYADGDRILPDTVSTPEVALALGVSEAGVRQLVHRGELTPLKGATKPLRFRRAVVDRVLAARGLRPLA